MPRHKRSARGYSLTEMLVAITIVSIVTSVAAVTLHRVFRADARLREELASSLSLDRLATQFRADTHAADGVAQLPDRDPAGENADRLRLLLPDDRAVDYEAGETGVTRIVRRGESVAHRDTFRLDARFRARFTAPAIVRLSTVTLRIERRPAEDATAEWTTWLRVETIVGLDPRAKRIEL